MGVSLSIFVPQLVQPLKAWQDDFGFVPETPVLSSLLAHCHVKKTASIGFERSLFSALGFPGDKELPIARYRICEETFDAGISTSQLRQSQQTLLCADPVHCEVGMNDVTLTEKVNDLSEPESDELIALLNQHFAEDGLRFFAGRRGRWYVQLDKQEVFSGTLLDDVVGKNIFPYLPTSKDRNWLSLQNEVQMLLHAANLNQTREISGLPSVNSLWFWGGGECFKPRLNFDAIFAREACSAAQVFAKASGTQWCDLSFDNIEKLLSQNTHRNLAVIFDQLVEPAQMTDIDRWQAELNGLEKAFIEPLQAAWKKGHVDLSLDTCYGKIFTPLKTMRWKFWQSPDISLLDLS